MFGWLTRLFKEDSGNNTWDGQYRAFLQGLSEKKTPRISARWSLGYLYTIVLNYGDVSVEVQYNTVRHKWEIETWSREAQKHLFYYDCLNTPPYKAMEFVVNRYNLCDMVNKAVAQKDAVENKSVQIANEVVKKYT